MNVPGLIQLFTTVGKDVAFVFVFTMLEASDESGVSNAWLQILSDRSLKLTQFASIFQDTGNQEISI